MTSSIDQTGSGVLPGDVIQISEGHHWFPCFATVSELKSWGVQAYVLIPHNDGTPAGAAYIRIKNGQFERVGAAVFMSADDAAERSKAVQS